MNDLVEALRYEGNLRVWEKENVFGDFKSLEDRIADDLCYKAANEIERLKREIEEARRYAFFVGWEMSETGGMEDTCSDAWAFWSLKEDRCDEAEGRKP